MVLVLVPIAGRVDGANRMYWTDAADGTIQRANLDGSSVENLVATGAGPQGIALDVTGGKMYWVEADGQKVRRANLDGSAVEDLVGSVGPADIALDVTGGKMYWTDVFVTGKIQRANLDGSAVEDLITFGAARYGIALDVTGGKMYWTDQGNVIIQRSNLDGSSVENLVTTGLSFPHGIALDLAGGKMYWTDLLTHKIQRANLDGSGVEDLVTGLENPAGIALDLTSGKMYWTDFGSHKIQRANLDGSGVEDLLTGLPIPVGIALELGPPLEVSAFLHGFGATANPPTLFLNSAPSSATTAKYKDSAGVKFAGGNLWKEIGTWPAEPTFSNGTLTALSDLDGWVGLKNSDDQGTRFDLRAEVYKNDMLVAAGETLCITGVTRNPDMAKEVIVSIAPFEPVDFNGTTEVLSLRVLTRIGTTGTGAFCGGHSNAVGLRLYFDAASRNSQFDVTIEP
jgi:sugar lactone lactonase YvrE